MGSGKIGLCQCQILAEGTWSMKRIYFRPYRNNIYVPWQSPTLKISKAETTSSPALLNNLSSLGLVSETGLTASKGTPRERRKNHSLSQHDGVVKEDAVDAPDGVGHGAVAKVYVFDNIKIY